MSKHRTQDPEDNIFTVFYEWPENWAWGQIPCNSGARLQLDLGKTTQGKPLVHPFLCRDTCTTFSPCSCSTSPELCHVSPPCWWPAGMSGISSSPIWGQQGQRGHASTSSGLTSPSLNLHRHTTSEKVSPALEKRYWQVPTANEHLPMSQSVTRDNL